MDTVLPQPPVPPSYAEIPHNRWLTALLVAVGTLASTIVLKIGPVQYLEIVYFALALILLLVFRRRRFRTTWSRPILRIGILYILFCVAAVSLAVYSLRFTFYYFPGMSPLSYPVNIALVRTIQLAASVFAMLWLADLFRKDRASLRFTMRIYFWTGVVSALYSLLSWPFDVLHIATLGVHSDQHRFRGFYNEGGPWGLYLISVFLLGIVLYRKQWEIPKRILYCAPLLIFALFMSGSKSAMLAAMILLLLNSIFVGSLARRLAVIAILVVFIAITAQVLNLANALRALAQSAATYERLSHLHSNDGNYVVGRIAGTFIVPRMIAAHPYSGVGWGNYGLLRNTPDYRGASTFAITNDQPALGLIGTAAELGLPLSFFLVLLLFLPFLYLRRLRAPVYVANLALLQPLVHIFGAQLNVTYPWIVTAFALGLAYSSNTSATPNIPPAAPRLS